MALGEGEGDRGVIEVGFRGGASTMPTWTLGALGRVSEKYIALLPPQIAEELRRHDLSLMSSTTLRTPLERQQFHQQAHPP